MNITNPAAGLDRKGQISYNCACLIGNGKKGKRCLTTLIAEVF